MKTVFHGYYGAQNSGDDAFIEVASWGAQKFWGSNEQLFFSSELPKIETPATFYSPHKNYKHFFNSILKIFNSDLFVSAGGSTFHSSLTKTDLRTYIKLKKALKIGKSGAIGISLGPYRNIKAEKDTIKYLKTLNFLALRDNFSFELATSYNLPYKPINAFDLAALLPDIFPSNDSSIETNKLKLKKIIGISICNYEEYINGDLNKQNRRNNYIKELIRELSRNKEIKFRFFIFNGNSTFGDKRITTEIISSVAQNFDYEIIEYQANVKSTWIKIKECDLMISTRLHASIFACYAEIPFFLFEYHRKCNDFLNDVGQSEKYLLHDSERSLNEITNEILQILFGSIYTPPHLREHTIMRSRLNFSETINL